MNASTITRKIVFSVGICAYNERDGISFLLPSLLLKKYKHTLKEIIVVSTCSRDGTDEVVESFKNTGFVNLIKESERKGKWTCVNTIMQMARNNKSEVIVLIPADVIPYPNAIDLMLDHFMNSETGCVSGHPIPQNNTGFTEHIGTLVWEMHHETFNSISSKGLKHASGEFMSFRPEIVRDLSIDTINDDTSIANDILKEHKKIIYEPEAKVAIWVPRNIRDWWTQRLRIVSGHHKLRKKGLETQEISVMPIGMRLKIIFSVMKNRRDLIPFIPILIMIEMIIRLRAKFEGQSTAWKMVSSAKPLPRK